MLLVTMFSECWPWKAVKELPEMDLSDEWWCVVLEVPRESMDTFAFAFLFQAAAFIDFY